MSGPTYVGEKAYALNKTDAKEHVPPKGITAKTADVYEKLELLAKTIEELEGRVVPFLVMPTSGTIKSDENGVERSRVGNDLEAFSIRLDNAITWINSINYRVDD